jgi:hypothetical protein
VFLEANGGVDDLGVEFRAGKFGTPVHGLAGSVSLEAST